MSFSSTAALRSAASVRSVEISSPRIWPFFSSKTPASSCPGSEPAAWRSEAAEKSEAAPFCSPALMNPSRTG